VYDWPLAGSTVSSMEIMRKLLSSPLTRRRHDHQSNGSACPPSSSTTAVSNGSSETDTVLNSVSGDEDSVVFHPRYFGVELSELVSRDGTDVPRLLLKLAHCICSRGY